MENLALSRRLLVIVFILGIIQVIYYYPQLPDQIATHFNASGQADGWSEKSFFIYFQIGFEVFLFGLFWGINWLITKLPVSAINIPNREYWLSPERKAASIKRILVLTNWIGVGTLILIIYLSQETVRYNMSNGAEGMQYIWPVLLIYMAFIGYMIFKSFRYFGKKEIPTGF